MFSYYGSKSKIVKYYPAPAHDKIIEPFAGSARYSLRYWDKDILLVDKYKVIVDIWHYLQRASQKDILGLPKLGRGMDIRTLNLSKDGEYQLLSFLCASSSHPGNIVSSWTARDYDDMKKFIIENLYKIKHWKIIHGSYEDLENENATWFIDPPYFTKGDRYKESNKNINFPSLANWCKSRLGQVIVCENLDATWLEFKPMLKLQGMSNSNIEAIWTNFKTQYDSIQLSLFDKNTPCK
jgi:hypothetical protein